MVKSIKHFAEESISIFEKLEDDFFKHPEKMAEYVKETVKAKLHGLKFPKDTKGPEKKKEVEYLYKEKMNFVTSFYMDMAWRSQYVGVLEMVERAMNADFSWKNSARQYEALYEQMV